MVRTQAHGTPVAAGGEGSALEEPALEGPALAMARLDVADAAFERHLFDGEVEDYGRWCGMDGDVWSKGVALVDAADVRFAVTFAPGGTRIVATDVGR